jgi:hypothetical protein
VLDDPVHVDGRVGVQLLRKPEAARRRRRVLQIIRHDADVRRPRRDECDRIATAERIGIRRVRDVDVVLQQRDQLVALRVLPECAAIGFVRFVERSDRSDRL